MARREPADDQHPLHASWRLSVVKPTLHEAPTDDSPPLPPLTKRKSPDLREEGIHKRLRMRCPAEHALRRSCCERGARVFADTLPGTPQCIACASLPLSPYRYTVVSVAMGDGHYFLVR
ncbi:hypothetical protein DFH09DRAFT_1331330 [Mycena vulgaris]|nr:hypothetical protein DFH09DRAFT_1331330 [Mycena vulgaris]